MRVGDFRILWYGALFALGFMAGFRLFVRRLRLYFRFCPQLLPKESAAQIADRVMGWMVVATVVGARVAHLLFYERPEYYLCNPLVIVQVWKGGLSSHGAAVGIVVALFWLAKREKRWGLSGWKLLDLVVVPAGLVGALIRLGNFINQEVVGTPTDKPWGVVFLHPMDGSAVVPRHPVQLYESIFYLAVFGLLWGLSGRRGWLVPKGRLLGLFLALVFGFRVVAEGWKVEQSAWGVNVLTMGQWLSFPICAVGLWLFLRNSRNARNF